MKCAISHIAWNQTEDKVIFALLQKSNIAYIELAPTRVFSDLTMASAAAARTYKQNLQNFGLTPVAMQSLLYGQPELQIFTELSGQKKTLKYLHKIILLAAELGTMRLVFGSPQNRHIPPHFDQAVNAIAKDFFWQVGELCRPHNILFCLEPNAPQYGCNFLTNTQETVDFIQSLAHPNVQLHLDAAVMTLNQEDIPQSFLIAKPYLQHFHISEPYLGLIGSNPQTQHTLIAQELQKNHYQHTVSIEMKAGILPANNDAIKQALAFVAHHYGSTK